MPDSAECLRFRYGNGVCREECLRELIDIVVNVKQPVMLWNRVPVVVDPMLGMNNLSDGSPGSPQWCSMANSERTMLKFCVGLCSFYHNSGCALRMFITKSIAVVKLTDRLRLLLP